jgi:hypothetical protein
MTDVQGVECVKFWSSNNPSGYGETIVPKAKVKRAPFSRIETPEALNAVTVIPQRDSYLESMLVSASTVSEMVKQCGH